MVRPLILAAALSAAFAAAGPALAGGVSVSDVRIVRGSPVAAAAYFTITNDGEADDRLVAARSDDAKRTELHTSIVEDGVAKMRPLEGGVAVPAGGDVTFAQGGMHVMMMGPDAGLDIGATARVTLEFERAGDIEVEATVEAPGGAGSGMQGMDHMGGDGG